MTTEVPPTDPTDPLPPAEQVPSKDDPDNWHAEDEPAAPVEGLLTGKPGQIKPDNWHAE